MSAESPTPCDTTALVRCPTVWYEDGNIVIQAEGSLFKLLRGVLASKSAVFRNMLEFPQPARDDSMDGCPIVRLSDTAFLVEHALRALYGDRLYFDSSELMTEHVLASLLQMGTKYEMQDLRREAVSRLTAIFLDSLEHWLQMFRRGGGFPRERIGHIEEFTLASSVFTHDVDVALPAMFLTCALHSYSALAPGSSLLGTLSPAVLPIIIPGKEQLQRAQIQLVRSGYTPQRRLRAGMCRENADH